MGFVSLTGTLNTGADGESPDTGRKPEKSPFTPGWTLPMGRHGWSKVDCTTEWFCREREREKRE
jgi:hypothetical protein